MDLFSADASSIDLVQGSLADVCVFLMERKRKENTCFSHHLQGEEGKKESRRGRSQVTDVRRGSDEGEGGKERV